MGTHLRQSARDGSWQVSRGPELVGSQEPHDGGHYHVMKEQASAGANQSLFGDDRSMPRRSEAQPR